MFLFYLQLAFDLVKSSILLDQFLTLISFSTEKTVLPHSDNEEIKWGKVNAFFKLHIAIQMLVIKS